MKIDFAKFCADMHANGFLFGFSRTLKGQEDILICAIPKQDAIENGIGTFFAVEGTDRKDLALRSRGSAGKGKGEAVRERALIRERVWEEFGLWRVNAKDIRALRGPDEEEDGHALERWICLNRGAVKIPEDGGDFKEHGDVMWDGLEWECKLLDRGARLCKYWSEYVITE